MIRSLSQNNFRTLHLKRFEKAVPEINKSAKNLPWVSNLVLADT